MHCSTYTTITTTTLAISPNMHPIKPFLFTLKLILLLLSLSAQPLADANTQNLNSLNIEQVTLNHNNNISFGSEYDDTLDASSSTIESEIIAQKFRYLIKFGVKINDGDLGPKDTYAIPDTGSDLIWLYGKTCESNLGGESEDSKCYCAKYEKSKEECIEKPKESFYCGNPRCDDLKEIYIKTAECPDSRKDKDLCEFSMSYVDGTKSKGIYGPANLWFKSKTDKEETLNIGFSFPTSTKEKHDEEPKSQGVVGLGSGKLSLIRQYQHITRKFSYYLPQFRCKDEEDIKAKSKFTFGHDVKFSEQLSTPLTEQGHSLCKTRYCVHLKSISVGEGENNKITISDDTHEAHKVMIIDSGHTFTHLSEHIFKTFLEIVEKELHGRKGKNVSFYDNCYEKDGKVEKLLKKISFEFQDIKIELKSENFLDDFSYKEPNKEEKHYVCLTVESQNKKYHQRLRNYGKSEEEKIPHILGSRAQMDFLVAFKFYKNINKVSFKDKIKHSEELSVLSE